jgi:Tfp pilus assembly protein PilF
MATSARLDQIRAMLRDEPGDVFLRYGLGMEYLSLGDDEAAVTEFRGLIAASPEYVPSYLMLGQTLQRLGREPEAADVLRHGAAAARKAGDLHAVGEIEALLAIVE